MNKDTLCPLPWVHVSTTANGKYRACCLAVHEDMKDRAGNVMKVKTHSFTDALNSELSQNMRNTMLRGERPAACARCFNVEDLGGISARNEKVRQHQFTRAKAESIQPNFSNEPQPIGFPTHLDIRLGNLCNLKCLMCDPYNSNQWYDDWEAINGSLDIDKSDFQWADLTSVGWREILDHISLIQEIYFTGGEPLINKNHFQLLDKIVESNLGHQISLIYHSNLSVHLPENLFYVWKNFKSVRLGGSIDATDQVIEYARFPANWQLIQKNILKIRSEKIDFWLSPTVSVLNIFHLTDLFEWAKSVNIQKDQIVLNTLVKPPYLSIQSLPTTAKYKIQENLQLWYELHPEYEASLSYIIQFMFKESKIEFINEFKEKSNILDKRRGTSLQKALPKLYSYLYE